MTNWIIINVSSAICVLNLERYKFDKSKRERESEKDRYGYKTCFTKNSRKLTNNTNEILDERYSYWHRMQIAHIHQVTF